MAKNPSELTDKQKRFCEEYLVDLNASAAYLRAGYKVSAKAVDAAASRLLGTVKVKTYIRQLQQQQSHRTEITADKVLNEIAKVAFSDITDVLSFDADGIVLKDSRSLGKDITPAIASISHRRGRDGDSFSVKMHNKLDALQKLAVHLGLLSDFNVAVATLEKYGISLKRLPDGGWTVEDSTTAPTQDQRSGHS